MGERGSAEKESSCSVKQRVWEQVVHQMRHRRYARWPERAFIAPMEPFRSTPARAHPGALSPPVAAP